ncbi:hypothetical protein [Tunturiibacter gelidiferens]|uniref:hypothetical protein n=1 Tax=Tunturiibacter gelidiferens TaxID=3069689 RepID=UPI003D9B7251
MGFALICSELHPHHTDSHGDNTIAANTKTRRQTCATEANNARDVRNTEEALLKSYFMLAVRADGEIIVVAFGANEPIMEGSELACVLIFPPPL